MIFRATAAIPGCRGTGWQPGPADADGSGDLARQRLKPAILSFQDEYAGEAALVFWLPSGDRRLMSTGNRRC